MRFGVCTSDSKQLPLVQQYGYDYVESMFLRLVDLPEEDVREMACAVEKTGIPVEGFNCFLPPSMKLIGQPDTAILEYAEKGFARARQLGGQYLVIGSGGARRVPEEYDKARAEEEFAHLLDALGNLAGEYGMELFLEPLNLQETNLINTVSQAAQMCCKVGNARVNCLADFYHMSRMNEDFGSLKDAGAWLRHIHVSLQDRRIPAAEDKEECLAMAQAIKACGYEGRISLEGTYAPDFETAICQFRKLMPLFI